MSLGSAMCEAHQFQHKLEIEVNVNVALNDLKLMGRKRQFQLVAKMSCIFDV